MISAAVEVKPSRSTFRAVQTDEVNTRKVGFLMPAELYKQTRSVPATLIFKSQQCGVDQS